MQIHMYIKLADTSIECI